MKKTFTILLVVLMLLSMTACGKKDPKPDDGGNENHEELPNPDDGGETNPSDDNPDPEQRRGFDYWCELYGQNRCPFYISCDGNEKKYYFKNGGDLTFWVYTADNTDGWYFYNDHIISADNKYALDSDEYTNSFSSFCTYEAKPYDGATLTPEQQKEHLDGVFYVLNPYTPISTNWGIKFFKDSDFNPDADLPDSTVYGFVDTLKETEEFHVYIPWNPKDYPEFDGDTVDLWVFEHRDMSEYPEVLSDDLKDQSRHIGCTHYDEIVDYAHIKTHIPDKNTDGFGPGRYDIVLTYAGDVVVGLVTVNVVE